MKVLIEKVNWHLSKEMKEGTVTFNIKGITYNAFSFNNDFKEGQEYDVNFTHIPGDTTWDENFNNNSQKMKCLEQKGKWAFDGYGQIISINPVVANFGDIELELGDWTNDKRVIGEYIFWRISRLNLNPIFNKT